MSPKILYQKRLDEGEIVSDPEQARAVEALERLHGELSAQALQKRGWFSKKPELAKGVYMYGGVGRGKSMLMDLFAHSLPDAVLWRRSHFHEFMIDVHNHMHAARKSGVDVEKALPSFAKNLAKGIKVLCFDEFHVTDIADAMILGRLFGCLFEAGVSVVATSNWAPDRLYEGGLQRDRFTPFIELLKQKVEIVHLDSPTDYRGEFDQIEGGYFTPLNMASRKALDEVFLRLSGGAKVHADVIDVKGRQIEVAQAAGVAARFSFAQLCERPHGAEDYIEIAKKYKIVFLEDIPRLGYDRRNEAKRLMLLIDVLYEAHTRVIVSAAVSPDKLYSGHDHSYEFERTISRLNEMQSAEYQAISV